MNNGVVIVAVITAIITATLTISGWLVTHRNAIRLQQRKDQLELVNKRLSSLYGPLHALCEAGKLIYEQLLKKLNRPIDGGIFNDPTRPATERDYKEWFHWMKHVLGPLNQQRERLILDNFDLLLEDDIPKHIKDFLVHVAVYRAIMANWESGDFSEHSPMHSVFPAALTTYAESSFKELKKQQKELTRL